MNLHGFASTANLHIAEKEPFNQVMLGEVRCWCSFTGNVAMTHITNCKLKILTWKNVLGVGEIAQWIRFLPCKHEYLSLSIYIKKPGVVSSQNL